MRLRSQRDRRMGGTIMILVGALEFGVGCVIWYSKVPMPLHWLFWVVGLALLIGGRKMRRGY